MSADEELPARIAKYLDDGAEVALRPDLLAEAIKAVLDVVATRRLVGRVSGARPATLLWTYAVEEAIAEKLGVPTDQNTLETSPESAAGARTEQEA